MFPEWTCPCFVCDCSVWKRDSQSCPIEMYFMPLHHWYVNERAAAACFVRVVNSITTRRGVDNETLTPNQAWRAIMAGLSHPHFIPQHKTVEHPHGGGFTVYKRLKTKKYFTSQGAHCRFKRRSAVTCTDGMRCVQPDSITASD